MQGLDFIGKIAFIALLAGGIDLGLFGLFHFHLVSGILGDVIGRLLYIVVGISAGYLIYSLYLKDFIAKKMRKDTP